MQKHVNHVNKNLEEARHAASAASNLLVKLESEKNELKVFLFKI